MTKDRWIEVKEKLLSTFTGSIQGTEEEGIEHIEWVEFENPTGDKMRLEWHDSPKKLGEKTFHANRIGADVTIESEYSETERVQRVVLLTWNQGAQSWVEGDASSIL